MNRPFTLTVAEPSNPATGKPSVPMEKWGKDHWTTFAYLETCAVDDGGQIDHERMRCDKDRHPGLANMACNSSYAKKYPTRLNDGTNVDNHDDWDCFEDLIAMGLVTWEGTGLYPFVKFTDNGLSLAARLRAHKAAGGLYSKFNPGAI